MSFSAYPDYQDSGIAWVGEMPVHWGVKQLKWLFDLQKRPVRDEDEIVTAFRDGIVTLRKHRREEGFTNSLKEIGYQGIRMGDLVIHAMDGFAGAIGVSDSDGKSTPVYSVCKPKEGSLSEYYGRLLRYMALSGFVDSLAKGVRERSTEFRWRDASVLPLPVPPIGEQRAIVQFLDRETAKIDALVEEQERLIALLKEKRQAVISHAVTKGLDPDAPMKDSGIEWLGEIPAHWEVRRLKRLAVGQLSYGANEAANEAVEQHPRFVRITDVASDGTLRPDTFRSLPPDVAEPYLLEEGDILLARSGGTVGKSFIYRRSWGECCYAGYLIRLRVSTRTYQPDFVYLNLQSNAYWQQLGANQIQSTIQNFSAEKYGDMTFAFPPLEEQRAIASELSQRLSRFDELSHEAEQAITLLQERRAALISAAVTGKIDVRGLVEQHEMEAA